MAASQPQPQRHAHLKQKGRQQRPPPDTAAQHPAPSFDAARLGDRPWPRRTSALPPRPRRAVARPTNDLGFRECKPQCCRKRLPGEHGAAKRTRPAQVLVEQDLPHALRMHTRVARHTREFQQMIHSAPPVANKALVVRTLPPPLPRGNRWRRASKPFLQSHGAAQAHMSLLAVSAAHVWQLRGRRKTRRDMHITQTLSTNESLVPRVSCGNASFPDSASHTGSRATLTKHCGNAQSELVWEADGADAPDMRRINMNRQGSALTWAAPAWSRHTYTNLRFKASSAKL